MHHKRISTQLISRGVIIAKILGKDFPVDVRVTQEQADAAAAALKATRLLESALNRDDVKVNEIVKLVGEKHAAAIVFERAFGHDWPL